MLAGTGRSAVVRQPAVDRRGNAGGTDKRTATLGQTAGSKVITQPVVAPPRQPAGGSRSGRTVRINDGQQMRGSNAMTTIRLLALNAGSSSLKAAIFDVDNAERCILSGEVSAIGASSSGEVQLQDERGASLERSLYGFTSPSCCTISRG